MRLTYLPNPPPTANHEESAILNRILERRGPAGLNELDLTQFHAPLIADGFNAYFKALRTQNSLPPLIRELCFVRVAALLKAWYEWNIHIPIARENGLPQEAEEDIKRGAEGPFKGLDVRAQAVLALVDEMTVKTAVADSTLGKVKALFDAREVIEIVNCIAGFNALSKLVVALDVGEQNTKQTGV